MKEKHSFDLKSDWNYLPTIGVKRNDETMSSKSVQRNELDGLKYDDLMGLSWTILEECD